MLLLGLIVAAGLGGCYSFRGQSVPAHLKTVGIPPVEDNSGYGRGTVRQDMTTELVRKFRDDNSLRVVDPTGADSRLDVTITSINDKGRLNVSASEYETVLEMVISARVTFTDNVKKRALVNGRDVTGRASYRVDQGEAGRVEAIRNALDKLTSQILLEVTSDW